LAIDSTDICLNGNSEEHDFVAIPFLISALLKAAQLIRGIPDPEEQSRLLEASIQNILPGARRQGQGFIIQLAQYIEQVMIREHLVKVSPLNLLLSRANLW